MLNLVFVALIMSPFFAHAGGLDAGGKGGDEIGLQFLAAFNTAYGNIQKDMPDLFAKIASCDLPSIASKAHVIVVDSPVVVSKDGQKQISAAANDPDAGDIFVNRQRWQSISDTHEREALALHEMLGLKRFESTGDYPISYRYLSFYSPLQPHPANPGETSRPSSSKSFLYKGRGFFPDVEHRGQHWKNINLRVTSVINTGISVAMNFPDVVGVGIAFYSATWDQTTGTLSATQQGQVGGDAALFYLTCENFKFADPAREPYDFKCTYLSSANNIEIPLELKSP